MPDVPHCRQDGAGSITARPRVQPLRLRALIALSTAITAACVTDVAMAQTSPPSAPPSIAQCLESERKAEKDGKACIGKVSDPCLDTEKGGSTHGSVDCIRGELAEWDRLLNSEYRTLLTLLKPKVAQSIREAQRQWVKLRSLDCQQPYVLLEGGTMAQPMMAFCELDTTARRVIMLRGWRELAGER